MSERRRLPARTVYVISALFHGALWLGVRNVDRPEPPPPPPIVIKVQELPPEPPEPPKPPEPEPEPPPPEPAAEAPPEPAPELPPPPTPPAPKARKAEPRPAPEPAPAQSAAPEVPEFGVQMSNAGGPGGLSVPAGDPGGSGGGDGKREKLATRTRSLDPKPKKAAADECAEPEVKAKPLELPQPQYTEAARAAGVEGKVRVQLAIKADGNVGGVTVLASLHPDLDEAAKKAALAARFEPATRCGKPFASTLTISIKFTL